MTVKIIIVCLIILFFFLFLVLRIRKKRNNNFWYKLTNILIYLLEVFIVTTTINIILDMESFMTTTNFYLIFKDYLFAFSVYQILINIILKFWDGTTLDEFNTVIYIIKMAQLTSTSDKSLKKSVEIIEDKMDIFHEHQSLNEINYKRIKCIQNQNYKYLNNQIDKYNYDQALSELLLNVENEKNILSFEWQHSLILRLIK